jgi:hypothetical protein
MQFLVVSPVQILCHLPSSAWFTASARCGTFASMAHDNISVQINVAESTFTLVVVMTFGIEGFLDIANSVDVIAVFLLTDQRLTTLGVSLTNLTSVNARYADSVLYEKRNSATIIDQ